MKKTLLSLALLGAFSGAAFAQTNVTIYGVVDNNIAYSDNGASSNNKTWRLDSGVQGSNQSGSRLGFKGSEDLGGGLSAIFTLENGFAADDGTLGQSGRLFGRQAFVGLKGDFGAIKFGRQYNPIRTALESVDPFALGMAGDARAIFNVYGERADNTVNYTSPNVAGFVGQLAYSFGEVPGSFSVNRQVGLSAGYANGPIAVVLAYHKQNLATGTAPALTDNGVAKTTLLGGTYDFGVAKAHLGYAWNKGNTAAGVDNVDSRDLLVGVSAPVSTAGTVLASFQRHNNKQTGNANSRDWALGYTHSLSKRTNLYTSYGRISNDTLATKNFTSTAVTADNDPSIFNVGVRHTF